MSTATACGQLQLVVAAAGLSVAEDVGDDAVARDAAHGVVGGIGDVDVALGVGGDAERVGELGVRERGRYRRSS